MPAGDSTALEVTRLSVVRGGRRVLDDVSLRVARGAVCGLLGPSGCGKTTLMRSIVGVQLVAAGRITVLGEPAGAAGLRRRVAYVTQSPSVYADLTVAENLRYFGAIAGTDAARAGEVLRTVGLEAQRGQLVGALSDGQRSRVGLASALLADPELLVLDEPTVGIDPVLRRELWRTFHALAAAGRTLLVSSHQMEEARECDALVLMRDGAVLAQTTPDALRDTTGQQDLADAFVAVIEGAAA